MKPITTINVFKKYVQNSLFEISLPSIFLHFLSIFFLSSSIVYSQSNSCKATLQVEKNRFTQSVSPEGTTYTLEIFNMSSKISNYSLSATNLNSSCANNDGSNSLDNVNLSFSFLDVTSHPITTILLNPGEKKSFLVQVNIPTGTVVNRWNCTQINATASECSSFMVSTVLHTLVSDPNEE